MTQSPMPRFAKPGAMLPVAVSVSASKKIALPFRMSITIPGVAASAAPIARHIASTTPLTRTTLDTRPPSSSPCRSANLLGDRSDAGRRFPARPWTTETLPPAAARWPATAGGSKSDGARLAASYHRWSVKWRQSLRARDLRPAGEIVVDLRRYRKYKRANVTSVSLGSPSARRVGAADGIIPEHPVTPGRLRHEFPATTGLHPSRVRCRHQRGLEHLLLPRHRRARESRRRHLHAGPDRKKRRRGLHA